MNRNILKEEVDQFLGQSFWKTAGIKLTEEKLKGKPKLDESTEYEEVEEIDEAEEVDEAHVCPLCESYLEDPISDEQLAEHVDFFVQMISEMASIEDEDLEELDEAADEIAQEVLEDSAE